MEHLIRIIVNVIVFHLIVAIFASKFLIALYVLFQYDFTFYLFRYSNCNAQSYQCGTQFTADMCSVDLVRTYCPLMCKSIICTCSIDSCLNGGTFNPNTCSCQCRTGIYGKVTKKRTSKLLI